MLNNYKLIKFPNGKYGVRKGFIFYEYFDFTPSCSGLWWLWFWKEGSLFEECMTDENTAREKYLLFSHDEVIE